MKSGRSHSTKPKGICRVVSIKRLLRWIIRRDGDATQSFIAAKANELIFLIAIGIVVVDMKTGIAFYFACYAMRILVGWIDLYHVKATKYKNDYISNMAPMNVKIISEKSARGRAETEPRNRSD